MRNQESSDPKGARDESRLQKSVKRIFLGCNVVRCKATAERAR